MDILTRIVSDRRADIRRDGHGLGVPIPSTRQVPVVPFARNPGIICEVKRRSPSKGDISPGLDAVGQASLYRDSSVPSISVLTEKNYFGGSLADLIAVKARFPDVSVLRKDFLVDVEDIQVSYRAGADSVLLIAAMLERDTIREMYAAATDLGMAALVEIHDRDDAEKVRGFAPAFTGINSRDLKTFTVDPIVPLKIRRYVDWETRLVFESGLSCAEDARFARSNLFSAILVGEAAVRNPEIIGDLINGLEMGSEHTGKDFWVRLYERQRDDIPLVKICGITNYEDAVAAVNDGADVLGFVFAKSPRRADAAVVRESADLDVLKVGVVVTKAGGEVLEPDVAQLVAEGHLDAVQLHGDETPDACSRITYPYYKAVRLRDASDVSGVAAYRCPRVLLDAFSPKARGGTGTHIAAETLASLPDDRPLWLAGGLGVDNIAETIGTWQPELVDASSRLEISPGKKDHRLLSQYIQQAKHGRMN